MKLLLVVAGSTGTAVDFVTPALFDGIGVVSLLVFSFWMLMTGRLVTRREANGIERRAEKAEATVEKLTGLLDDLTESARLQQSMYEALREGAKK